ncbi:MAG: ATP-binding protein [Phycisphaeraceae bacterium]|nr:ATP-binding protein [Phycisphaeraceae bacterium]
MPESADITICILSQARYLSVVRAAIEAAALRMGLDEEQAGKVTLAADEAMTNVIRHGYKGEKNRPIWVRITPVTRDGASGMEIIIDDECTGVDLTRIKGRALEEVRPGGLGVHIITGVMDEVEYLARPGGKGIRLRMLKLAKPAVTAMTKI